MSDSCFEDDDLELEAMLERGESTVKEKTKELNDIDNRGISRQSQASRQPQVTRQPQSLRQTSRPQMTLDGMLRPTNQVSSKGSGIVSIATHHKFDKDALETYIYPMNLELRDYQYNIVARAFYDNLLAALPTGLGKTFIASTVMLNFTRWFPESKVIFMAPTRPLVAQQIKACCAITGIPSSKVAILLDKTRKNRGDIWDSKQVFFTTPQVVDNDLCSGLVDPKSISLLVIDEAHRARGNYAYNNVVKFMKRFSMSFRVLALTATPAADVEGVQEIINNLLISKVEVRTENSIDIIRYMKRKKVQRYNMGQSAEIGELIDHLCNAIEPTLIVANERKLIDMRDPLKINFFQCVEASRRLTMNKQIPAAIKWPGVHMLQLLGMVGQCLKRLNIYGIRSFYNFLKEKHADFTSKWNTKKSTNKTAASFYLSDHVTLCLERAQEFMADSTIYSHPKFEAIVEELQDFFIESRRDSKVIVFTELRESALELVQTIETRAKGARPHIFIGQSKEKEKVEDKNSKGKGKGKGRKEKVSTGSSSEDAQINGMSQKLQKEIIKQFKEGKYNVLVCTSIGEEGLDIGEVDLIVCYDSTSSPIKNIQRMGRTGRKRDGRVVLLFSGNEESKFDKAMGGYEHIQNYIMQPNTVELAPLNRMIPAEFVPKVDRKVIEIPEDNIEFKNEDDEDEIIRIATQHMTGAGKRLKPKKKQQKRFFMPDDVETGFRSVSSLLSGDRSRDEILEKSEKSVLDSIIDSSSDDDKDIREEKSLSDIGKKLSDVLGKRLSEVLETSPSTSRYAPSIETPKRIGRHLGVKKPRIQQDSVVMLLDDELVLPEYVAGDRRDNDHSNKNNEVSENYRISQDFAIAGNASTPEKAEKSISIQRADEANTSTPQRAGREEMNKSIRESATTPERTLSKRGLAETSIEESTGLTEVRNDKQLPNKQAVEYDNDADASPNSSDVFDDGLDEELVMISSNPKTNLSGDEDRPYSKAQSSQWESSFRHESVTPMPEVSSEPTLFSEVDDNKIFKSKFAPNEGLLTEEQQIELYSTHYTGLDVPLDTHFDPRDGLATAKKGIVGSSRWTELLIRLEEFTQKITPSQAVELQNSAKKMNASPKLKVVVKDNTG